MLLQFNVTNALSFRDEAILDLNANSDRSHEECLIKSGRKRILPAVGIYGANAAGKSNLFKAMVLAIRFVRESSGMQINSRINIIPFLMDSESADSKTRFDFIFINNGIKYEYGFTADSYRVYEEYLYEYRSAKPSMIFEREDVKRYRYTDSLKRKMKQYEEKNTDNKLFLATATLWNCKETENAFRWFSDTIDVCDSHTVSESLTQLLDSDEGEMRDFARQYLKAADFNISDYRIIKGATDNRLLMEHEITLSDGEEAGVELPYEMESNGTKLYFAYCPVVYAALKSGRTLVIDEIDNGLHPMLVRSLVSLFNSPDTNPNGAQLVFNTHDMELLDLSFMRRDQIYFVDKDSRTGASELYSLADYSPRNNAKVHKDYLLGRYGAVPDLGEIVWSGEQQGRTGKDTAGSTEKSCS